MVSVMGENNNNSEYIKTNQGSQIGISQIALKDNKSKKWQKVFALAAVLLVIIIIVAAIMVNNSSKITVPKSSLTSTILVHANKTTQISGNNTTPLILTLANESFLKEETDFITNIPMSTSLVVNISSINALIKGQCISVRATHVYVQNRTQFEEQYPNISKLDVQKPVVQYVSIGFVPAKNLTQFESQYYSNGGFCNTAYKNITNYANIVRYNYSMAGSTVHVLEILGINITSLRKLGASFSGSLPSKLNLYVASTLIGNAEIEAENMGFSNFSKGLPNATIYDENITIARYLNSSLYKSK